MRIHIIFDINKNQNVYQYLHLIPIVIEFDNAFILATVSFITGSFGGNTTYSLLNI
jgi:hypothetical protein